jgi:hypothetical protein
MLTLKQGERKSISAATLVGNIYIEIMLQGQAFDIHQKISQALDLLSAIIFNY